VIPGLISPLPLLGISAAILEDADSPYQSFASLKEVTVRFLFFFLNDVMQSLATDKERCGRGQQAGICVCAFFLRFSGISP
jgi:hypothetical protein